MLSTNKPELDLGKHRHPQKQSLAAHSQSTVRAASITGKTNTKTNTQEELCFEGVHVPSDGRWELSFDVVNASVPPYQLDASLYHSIGVRGVGSHLHGVCPSARSRFEWDPRKCKLRPLSVGGLCGHLKTIGVTQMVLAGDSNLGQV